MDPIRLAITQPITVAVGILLTLLGGYIALTQAPVEMTPEVQRGVIAVDTIYPNANPAEVEQDVLVEQEAVLRSLGGLERMTSTATRGSGSIRLELKSGVDIDVALREVNQLIREVPGYPENVLEPVISDTDPESNDYIAWFVVEKEGASSAVSEREIQTLFDFVDNRVAPRLERIEGISEVNVFGGRERELQVRVDPEKLAQRGMTMPDLITAIRTVNQDVSAGALAQGNYDVAIRVPSRWSSPQQAMSTVIRQDESGPVYLRDVAEAVESYREQSSFIRSSGVPALAMNFQRELGSNVLDVMARLQAEIDAINAEGALFDQYAISSGLDGTLRMRQVYDQTVYIDQAIGMVRDNLLLGAVLAVIVLILFLRSVRSVGIIALAIPVSTVGVAVAMVALGRTINVISLAGAAFAIGMVVDNSIVVLENIYRHFEMGKRPARAAYDGASEVALAVLASTLTTMIVFVPVLLIQQQVGELFRDLAIAICTAVLISYVVSILVIPSAAALLLRPRDVTHNTTKQPSRAYAMTLGQFGRVPGGVAAVVGFINRSIIARLAIVGAAMLLVVIGVAVLLPAFDYLPKGNRNIVFGLVITPPGYNIDQMDRIAATIEEGVGPFYDAGTRIKGGEQTLEEAQESLPVVPLMEADGSMAQIVPPPLENYFIVGFGGTIFQGGISLDDEKAVDIVPMFANATANIPGVFAPSFQLPIFTLGGSSGAAVKIDVVGDDLDDVTQGAMMLFLGLMGEFGPQSVQPTPANFNLTGPELQVRRDDLRASDVGVTDADLGATVQAYGDGVILRDAYKYPDELRDIVVIAQNAVDQENIADFGGALVATPYGSTVALEDVADLVYTDAPTEIRRVGGERAVTVEVTAPDGMPLGVAIERINAVVAGLRQSGTLPPTVSVDVAGTADALSDIQRTLLGDGTFFGTLSSSAVLALLAVYLLMCVLFQSWSYPFVIMFTVPLATFGGFLGLFLVNLWSGSSRYIPTTNLDVLAMLGFIILAGTVVNNAILIVEQSNNFLKMKRRELDEAGIEPDAGDRLSPHQAVVEGIRSRVRPIFMSMLTSVLGMLPLVLIPGSGTEIYRGLGAVVVGGLFVSTLFTLFVTPALLSLVFDLKQKLNMRLIPEERDDKREDTREESQPRLQPGLRPEAA